MIGATAGAVPHTPDEAGIPVLRYVPGVLGTPLAQEPYVAPPDTAVPKHIMGYKPIVLPPPVSKRKRGPAIVKVAIVAVLVLLIVGMCAAALAVLAGAPLPFTLPFTLPL